MVNGAEDYRNNKRKSFADGIERKKSQSEG
jgi:hypothetical protein